MPRLLFKKKGNAIWISHLDLMRVFQRAFKRADLPLTHTQGFNPRPSVSIALPLSVGIESSCELLDFDLDGDSIPSDEIADRLNAALIDGIVVLKVYDDGKKIKHITFLDCSLCLEYDNGIPAGAVEAIQTLFSQKEIIVEKKSKNGITEQNISQMIQSLAVIKQDDRQIQINSHICCQNPTLNPMQIHAAIVKYIPQYSPDFVTCCRLEIYDEQNEIFR